MGHVRAGKLVALGVTDARRGTIIPDLPTMIEAGVPDCVSVLWFGLAAPAGTPQPIIDKLAAGIKTALDDPNVFKRLQEAGVDPTLGRGPKEATEFMKAELAKWAPIIKMSGAVVN
jgi:tripartite-type tricarboxylate transporter receptor subunit TctC